MEWPLQALLLLAAIQTMTQDHFFILTGGPGSGKTTLIEALKAKGYPCQEEAGRLVIQEEMKTGGDAVPWGNIERFKEKMLGVDLAAHAQALKQGKGVVFFDRGVLDLIAYDRLTKTKSSPRLEKAARTLKYNKKVFIAPPWEEIYCNDKERKQSFEEAVDTYRHMADVYREYGYELLELPKSSVADRLEFIFKHIKN